MKRIPLSILVGIICEGAILLIGTGSFGPCGPTSVLGLVTLVSIIPGALLADILKLTGAAQVSVCVVTPVVIFATIAWVFMACVERFRRRHTVPEQS